MRMATIIYDRSVNLARNPTRAFPLYLLFLLGNFSSSSVCCCCSCSFHRFYVDTSRVHWETDARFLSVAIDSHVIEERWKHFDFTSRRVRNMAAALAPAYFRLGGTAADLTIFRREGRRRRRPRSASAAPSSSFSPNDASSSSSSSSSSCYCTTNKDESGKVCEDLEALYARGNFTMSGDDWIKMNEFSGASGWTLLFDLNVLLRNGSHWNEANARELLDFSSSRGFANEIAFELGNEPNSLFHQLHFQLDGSQLGRDFYRLKKLLHDFPLYANATLVGPDVNAIRKCHEPKLGGGGAWMKKKKGCKALKYLAKVLAGSNGVLDAITWHHYYLDGKTATLDDFLNPDTLDSLNDQQTLVNYYLRRLLRVEKPIWLGETASAYGGGIKYTQPT